MEEDFGTCTDCWYAEHGECSLGNEPCHANELDIVLDEDEAAELIVEVESMIQAIKDGEVEGEYFEF